MAKIVAKKMGQSDASKKPAKSRILNEILYTFLSLFSLFGLLSICTLTTLTGCATHGTQYLNYAAPRNMQSKYFQFAKGQMEIDRSQYLYTPPRIYSTWIKPYINQNNDVTGAHVDYWVANPGHWNIPIQSKSGMAAEILQPT